MLSQEARLCKRPPSTCGRTIARTPRLRRASKVYLAHIRRTLPASPPASPPACPSASSDAAVQAKASRHSPLLAVADSSDPIAVTAGPLPTGHFPRLGLQTLPANLPAILRLSSGLVGSLLLAAEVRQPLPACRPSCRPNCRPSCRCQCGSHSAAGQPRHVPRHPRRRSHLSMPTGPLAQLSPKRRLPSSARARREPGPGRAARRAKTAAPAAAVGPAAVAPVLLGETPCAAGLPRFSATRGPGAPPSIAATGSSPPATTRPPPLPPQRPAAPESGLCRRSLFLRNRRRRWQRSAAAGAPRVQRETPEQPHRLAPRAAPPPPPRPPPRSCVHRRRLADLRSPCKCPTSTPTKHHPPAAPCHASTVASDPRPRR
mmetsp:Transcript_56233/g.182519  ORF Transcript_56233/g.182519 Transcript_56233/m.182519 type:complete len:373 (+) Transcript_56233:160-1278(+)